MKRSPLLRKSRLVAKTPLERTSKLISKTRLRASKLLTASCSLKRTAMKRKPRRIKPGSDPVYKAWVKTQPCVVCGKKGRGVDPHHIINGKGDARKGMGQTAPDRFLLSMCRREHEQFHKRVGFCKDWDDARRLTFQEMECERLRSIWADLLMLGVYQEPIRKAV